MPTAHAGSFITQNPQFNPGGTGSSIAGSTAYEQLYNRLIGNMTVGNIASMANGANWSQQRQLYDQSGGGFRDNGEEEQQNRSMWSGRQRYQYEDQKKEEDATYHEANNIEGALSNFRKLGNNLMNATGFSRNRQTYGPLDPRTLLSFPATIPAGIFAGMSEAPSQIYEAFSGKNVTNGYRDENGVWQIKDEDLSPEQRIAQGINAGINIGSPFIGGTGDLLVTGASAAKAIGSNILRNRVRNSTARYATEIGAANAAREAGQNAVQAVNQTTSTVGSGLAGTFSSKLNRAANAGRNVMDNLPLGVINRRTGGLRAAEGTAPGALRVIGSDAAVEGAEEFVQSYLEDVRNNDVGDESFARATEGALWGALGGAMMGGASHLGGQAVARYQQDKDTRTGAGNNPHGTEDVTNRTPSGDGTRRDADVPSDRFAAFRFNENIAERDQESTAMSQYLNEKHSRGNKVQGAVPVQLTSGGRISKDVFVGKDDNGNDLFMRTTPNNSNAGFGEQYFYNLYQTGRAAQELIASNFNITIDEVHRMFNRERTLENMQENCMILNRAIYDLKMISRRNGTWVQPIGAWGKNPASSTHSVVPIYIDYVGVGNYINGDPSTIELLKSDADGDILLSSMDSGQAYDAARQHDFTVRSLGMNDAANVVTDMEYSSFMDPSLPEGSARVDAAIDTFVNELNLTPADADQLRTDLRNRYTTAYRSGNPQMFANFFTYAEDYADRNQRRNLDRNYVSVMAAQMWKDLETPNELEILAREALANPQSFASRSVGKIDDNETRADAKRYSGRAMGVDRNADFSDRKHAVQVVHMLDLRTGFVAGERGNPVFRQNQMWKQSSDVVRLVTDFGQYDVALNPAEFVAEIRGLLDTGLDPLISIVSMFREFVHSETWMRYQHETNKNQIENAEDWEVFQKIFSETYNKYRDQYKNAIKGTQYQDEKTGEYGAEFDPLGLTPPPEIAIKDGKPLDVSFNRAFSMMYGDSRVDFVFDIPVDHVFANLTFDQMCKHIAYGEASAMAFYQKGLNHAVSSMVETFNIRVKNCEKTLDGIIDNNVENYSRRLYEENAIRLDDNGIFRVNPEYAEDLEYLHEYYTSLLPPEAFMYFPSLGGRNIGSPNTAIGRTLLTARTKNEAKNALLSIALATDYFDVINDMNTLNQETNPERQQIMALAILHKMASFQGKSALHRVLFEDAASHYANGEYQTMINSLDRLMDGGISYSDKARIVGEVIEPSLRKDNENERAEPASLLTLALADGGSDVQLANLATRMRKAATHAQQLYTNRRESLITQVENGFEKSFVDNPDISDRAKSVALQYAMDTVVNEASKSACKTLIMDGLDIYKPDADKISVLDSQQYLYNSIENAIFGSHQQHLEATTNGVCGMVNMSVLQDDTVMLMRLCSDSNFRILVKDDIHGGRIYYMSQLALFESIGEQPISNSTDPTMLYTPKQYAKLFKKYPELYSRMGKISTSVNMVGQKAAFSEKRVESASTTLIELAYDYDNNKQRLEEKMQRAAAMQAAMNDAAFYGFIPLFMPDISSMTDHEISEAIDKAFDDCFEYWYWRSNLPFLSPERINLVAETRNNAMLGFIDQFRDLIASNDFVRDMMHRGSHIPAQTRRIIGDQISEINDILFYAQFTNEYNAPYRPRSFSTDSGLSADISTDRIQMLSKLEQLRLIELAISTDPLNQGTQNSFAPSEEAISEVTSVIDRMEDDARNAATEGERRMQLANVVAAREFVDNYQNNLNNANQLMLTEVCSNGVTINLDYMNTIMRNTLTTGARPVVSPFMLNSIARYANRLSRSNNGIANEDTFRDSLIRAADDIVYWINSDFNRIEPINIAAGKLPAEFREYRAFFLEVTRNISNANAEIVQILANPNAVNIARRMGELQREIDENVNRLNTYCERFNTLITNEVVRQETLGTQNQVTQNSGLMVYDMLDMGLRIERSMRTARDAMARRQGFEAGYWMHSVSSKNDIPPCPVDINSLNASNAALAQQVMMRAGSAGLASIISSNSQAVGDVGAAAIVPTEYGGGTIPQTMTLRELNRMILDPRNDESLYFVQFVVGEYNQDDIDNNRIPANELMRVTEESVERLLEDNITEPDQIVTVFVRDVAGQFDEKASVVDFTDRDPNEPSMMAITSHAMKCEKENLGARAMRNMSSVNNVVSRIDIDENLNVANPQEGFSMLNIDVTTNQYDAWSQLSEMLVEYRKALADRIYRQWRDDGITDVSRYDCLMIAEYLVSTFMVSDAPGQTADVYHTSWLTTRNSNTEHKDLLKQLLDDAASRGQQTLCFTILPLSFHDIAGRIMDAQARWQVTNKREMRPDDRRELAYALTDFRKRMPLQVLSGPQAVAEVMSGVKPLSLGVTATIKLAGTRTPGQRMMAQNSPHRPSVDSTMIVEHGITDTEYRKTVINAIERDGTRLIDLQNGSIVGYYGKDPDPDQWITAVFNTRSMREHGDREFEWASDFSGIARLTTLSDDSKDAVGGDGLVLAVTERDVPRAFEYAKKHKRDLLITEEIFENIEPKLRTYLSQFLNDDGYRYEYDGGEVDFVSIDINQLLQREVAGAAGFGYQVEQTDPRIYGYVFYDTHRFFDLGDSVSVLFATGRDYMGTDGSGEIDVPKKEYFGKDWPYEVTAIDASDLDRIITDVPPSEGGNLYLEHYRGIYDYGRSGNNTRSFDEQAWSSYGLGGKVRAYLDRVRDPDIRQRDYSDEGFMCIDNYVKGDCLTILKSTDNMGRTLYAPVFSTKAMPNRISRSDRQGSCIYESRIDERGHFRFSYKARIAPGEGDFQKSMNEGDTSKTNTFAMESDIPAPTLGDDYQSVNYGKVVPYELYDGVCAEGRSYGQKPANAARSKFNEMQVMGGSLFGYSEDGMTFTPNEEFRQYINSQRINNPRTGMPIQDNYQALLMGGEDGLVIARALVSGDITFTDDYELNCIYRAVMQRCLDGIEGPTSYLTVFHSIEVCPEHGNVFTVNPCRTNIEAIFGGFNFDQICRFFHHVSLDCTYVGPANEQDSYCKYCPDGASDRRWARATDSEKLSWRWNNQGEMSYKGKWSPVYFGLPMQHGHNSQVSSVPTTSSYSYEHKTFDLWDKKLIPSGRNFGGLLNYYGDKFGYFALHGGEDSNGTRYSANANPYGVNREQTLYDQFGGDEYSYLANSYRRKCIKLGNDTFDLPVMIEGDDGILRNLRDDEEITSVLEHLERDLLEMNRALTDQEVIYIYMQQIGMARTSADTINKTAPKDRFLNTMRHVIRDLKLNMADRPLLIYAGRTERADNEGSERMAIPLVEVNVARSLWRDSNLFRTRYQTFEKFQDNMVHELIHAEELIETDIINQPKKRALYRFCDYLRLGYGMDVPIDHLFRDQTAYDRAQELIAWRNIFEADPDIRDGAEERIEAANEYQRRRNENYQNRRREMNRTILDSGSTRSGVSVHPRAREGFLYWKGWDELAKFRRTMGVLNPFMPVGNIIGRVTHGGIMNLMLNQSQNQNGLGRFLYHPGIIWTNNGFPNQLANDPRIRKYFNALVAASYSGQIEEVQNLKNEEELDAWIKSQKTMEGNPFTYYFHKLEDGIFKFANGFDIGRSIQIESFFNVLASRIGNDNGGVYDLYATTHELVPNEGEAPIQVSELEMMLQQDPIGTLSELFSGPAGEIAASSWNTSLQGDYAQRNVVAEMILHACGRFGLVNFLTSSFISPYITYSTNLAGRIMSAILPMSSLHYLIVERMADSARFADWNLRDIHTRGSLKEALIADAIHMGPVLLGMALAVMGMSMMGLFEPPDDEDKICNINEWKIFGSPVNTAWWAKDVLVGALPIAGALYCVLHPDKYGKYAGTVLFQGFSDVLYNNPLFSISNIIDSFVEISDGLVTGKYSDGNDYSKAPGGNPTAFDAFASQTGAAAVNFVTSYVTPSVIKDIYSKADAYQRSYKLEYVRDANGEMILDPDTGQPQTERVSYYDAQLKRLCRNNPFMGFLLNTLNNTNEYTRDGMPPIEIREPVQMWSANHLSLKNEDGSYKTEAEQQAIAYEVINTLMVNDDMEELWKSGYYIPPETKAFVGKVIYDVVHALEDNYANIKMNGGFNYYAYGDYETGEAVVEKVKKAYTEEYRMWTSLYHDKLYSDPMRRPMQTYYLMNQTYQQDINGDWYNSGYRQNPFPILPFAPMSTGEATGEQFGYSTNSVLDDSISTGIRGLMAVNQGYEDKPNWDSLGSDSNGYSNAATGVNGGSWAPGWNGWSGYSGSRGYGGFSSGGGRPSIRSYTPNLNISYPTTMNTSRWYGSNPDYLRPSFKTKGSREASRREDF